MSTQRPGPGRSELEAVYRRRRAVAALLAGVLVIGIVTSARAAWRVWRGESRPSPTTAASSPAGTPSATLTPTHSETPTATPSPTASKPPVAHRDPITITFAGDTHFEGAVRANLTRPSANTPALADMLSASTFTILNLETAITTRGAPIPGKPFTFRAPASALDFIKGLGVDVVSMANNHAADFGSVGLQDTLAARGSGVLPVIGIGKDIDDALTPLTVDIGGVRTAIFANSQIREETSAMYAAGPGKPGIVATVKTADPLVAAVKEARADHELVIVFPHWGTEATTCPDANQKRLARDLADAGADVVVGGHAHRVQGSGWLGDTFVGYGLGNFIWYNIKPPSGDSGALTLTIDPDRLAKRAAGEQVGSPVTAQKWTPMLIQGDGIPVVAKASADRLMAAKTAADQCSALAQSAP